VVLHQALSLFPKRMPQPEEERGGRSERLRGCACVHSRAPINESPLDVSKSQHYIDLFHTEGTFVLWKFKQGMMLALDRWPSG
jgi:hypothetical protein